MYDVISFNFYIYFNYFISFSDVLKTNGYPQQTLHPPVGNHCFLKVTKNHFLYVDSIIIWQNPDPKQVVYANEHIVPTKQHLYAF